MGHHQRRISRMMEKASDFRIKEELAVVNWQLIITSEIFAWWPHADPHRSPTQIIKDVMSF